MTRTLDTALPVQGLEAHKITLKALDKEV